MLDVCVIPWLAVHAPRNVSETESIHVVSTKSGFERWFVRALGEEPLSCLKELNAGSIGAFRRILPICGVEMF